MLLSEQSVRTHNERQSFLWYLKSKTPSRRLGTAPLLVDLGTRGRWLVSFKPRLFCPSAQSKGDRVGTRGKDRNLLPLSRIETRSSSPLSVTMNTNLETLKCDFINKQADSWNKHAIPTNLITLLPYQRTLWAKFLRHQTVYCTLWGTDIYFEMRETGVKIMENLW